MASEENEDTMIQWALLNIGKDRESWWHLRYNLCPTAGQPDGSSSWGRGFARTQTSFPQPLVRAAVSPQERLAASISLPTAACTEAPFQARAAERSGASFLHPEPMCKWRLQPSTTVQEHQGPTHSGPSSPVRQKLHADRQATPLPRPRLQGCHSRRGEPLPQPPALEQQHSDPGQRQRQAARAGSSKALPKGSEIFWNREWGSSRVMILVINR